MRKDRLFFAGIAAALVCLAIPLEPLAQTRPGARTQPEPERCLRALNGACTNPVLVEAARMRAIILPSMGVSYYGTPAGSIGGSYIPFERFFRDNPILFGLPTDTYLCCNTFQRSK